MNSFTLKSQMQGLNVVVEAAHSPCGSPTLLLFADSLSKAPIAVIEVPEHGWIRSNAIDNPMPIVDWRWFQEHGPVLWERVGHMLRFSLELTQVLSVEVRVGLSTRSLTIRYIINNKGDQSFQETRMVTCNKLYRPFLDTFLERTFVHHVSGLELLGSDIPERFVWNAEEWLPCRVIARSDRYPVANTEHLRKREGSTCIYIKEKMNDAPFIATESDHRCWTVVTSGTRPSDVWSNPARSCHHVDEGAPLPPYSAAVVDVDIRIERSTAEKAWECRGEPATF